MLCPTCGGRVQFLVVLIICVRCRYAAVEYEFLGKCRANGYHYHMEGNNVVFEDDRLFEMEVP